MDTLIEPSVRPGRPKHARRARRRLDGHAVVSTAVVVTIYLALAVAVFWHIWSDHPSSTTLASGDPFQAAWYMNWWPFAFGHGLNPLHTYYSNYPWGVNVLSQTSMATLGILGAPVTALFGAVLTFNMWSTIALAGSATTMYFFTRRLTDWRPAAFVAGLLFGFSPYVIAQSVGHMNLSFVVLLPLIFMLLYDIVVVQRGRPWVKGVVLAALIVGQYFVEAEILATTAMVAAIALVVVCIVGRRSLRSHLPYAARGLGWALAISAVVLVFPLWYSLLGPGHISGPVQLVPQGYRADLLGPIVPDHFERLAPASLVNIGQHFANSEVENGSYLGITLVLVLAVGAVVLRRSKVVQVTVLTAAAAFVLSLGARLAVYHAPALGPHGAAGRIPLPEALLARLPVLSNIEPARFALYVALFAALLLAVIVDRLYAAVRGGEVARGLGRLVGPAVAGGGICAVLSVAVFVPLVPTVPFAGVESVTPPAYFQSVGYLGSVPAGSAALEYPMPSGDQPTPIVWAAQTGPRFKAPGSIWPVPGFDGKVAFEPDIGYVVDTPVTRAMVELYRGTPPPQTPAERAALLAELRAWHIESVIAFPTGTQPGQVAPFFTWLLGRPPDTTSGALAWYRLQG